MSFNDLATDTHTFDIWTMILHTSHFIPEFVAEVKIDFQSSDLWLENIMSKKAL